MRRSVGQKQGDSNEFSLYEATFMDPDALVAAHLRGDVKVDEDTLNRKFCSITSYFRAANTALAYLIVLHCGFTEFR